MKPSKRLIALIILWSIAAIVVASFRVLGGDEYATGDQSLGLYLVLFVGFLIALYDFFQPRHAKSLTVSRDLPSGLAVGSDNSISVRIENTGQRDIYFSLTELVGAEVRLVGLPYQGMLAAGKTLTLDVAFHPVKRGEIVFGGLQALITSPLGLWQSKCRYHETHTVNVYPNFTAVSNFELLAHGSELSHLGIHLNQRRGEGLDFRQLREFRPGDALRQVDWKASSRYNKPISREFQDERDQDIIFLLDNGRRMRSKDGELSHFDHCLNAMLLCAYVALKQGDAVGLMSFGSEKRWQSPVKGRANLNILMQRVFDLHSSTDASDYLSAAAELIKKHKKRSLIVLVTNADAYSSDDLIAAAKLLEKNHLVVIACLREAGIDQMIENPVTDFTQALAHSASIEFLSQRSALIKKLMNGGALVLDEHGRHLHIALVNTYLELKRSGRL